MTYAQFKEDGTRITWDEFSSECARILKGYPFLRLTVKDQKLCKKLYNKGESVTNAVSCMILNN